MAQALRAHEFLVWETDILEGRDFFSYTPPVVSDAIVTNPPYSIKYPWMKRCFELNIPFALLMPLEMIGSQKGYKMCRDNGVSLMVLSKRINFKMPSHDDFGKGSAQFPVAWYCWNLGVPHLAYGEVPNIIRV